MDYSNTVAHIEAQVRGLEVVPKNSANPELFLGNPNLTMSNDVLSLDETLVYFVEAIKERGFCSARSNAAFGVAIRVPLANRSEPFSNLVKLYEIGKVMFDRANNLQANGDVHFLASLVRCYQVCCLLPRAF